MKTFWIEKEMAYIRFIDTDKGSKTLVFLHGLGSSSLVDFSNLLIDKRFCKFRLVLIDLLGFGVSDKPAGFSYSLYEQADLVSVLLNELKIESYSLIGHSMGGTISIALTQKEPDKINQLILMEPNLDPGIGSGSKIIASQTEEKYISKGHQDYVNGLKTCNEAESSQAIYYGTYLLSTPIALHRSATKLLEGTNPIQREVLKSFKKDKYLIVGEQNQEEYPNQEMELLGCQTVRISNAGHAMMHDNPSEFQDKLLTLIEN